VATRAQPRRDSTCASAANAPSWSEHLEHGLQHADDGAVGAVHAFVESAQAVEVTEEFVSAVDEVNDHFGSMLAFCRGEVLEARESGVLCRLHFCFGAKCLDALKHAFDISLVLSGEQSIECCVPNF
jgi:hypothetical protein